MLIDCFIPKKMFNINFCKFLLGGYSIGWYTQKNKRFYTNNPKITQSGSDLKLFIGKNMFLDIKKLIIWGIKQSTSVLVQT